KKQNFVCRQKEDVMERHNRNDIKPERTERVMKNKIPCDMIKDLFPSYLDGLTSEVSNQEIDAHLEECEDCRQVLEDMKEPKNLLNSILSEEDKKEIDFLRKVRRKRFKWIVLGSALILVFIVLGILLRKSLYGYVIDDSLSGDMIMCEVEMKGRDIIISGAILDENYGDASAVGMGENLFASEGKIHSYSVEDGSMKVPFHTVAHKKLGGDLLYQGFLQNHEWEGEPIHEVWMRDKIIWADGENILPRAAAVFRERHDYVGDHVADGRLTQALGLDVVLSKKYADWNTSLQTKEEPYGWTIRIKTGQRQIEDEDVDELKSYGYVLLAAVGILSEMNFAFYEGTSDFEKAEPKTVVHVTKEEAAEYASDKMDMEVEDIHDIGKDAKKLQKLLEVTGILDTAYPNRRLGAGDTIHIRLYDSTEEKAIKTARLKIQGYDYSSEQILTAEGTPLSDTLLSGFYDFEISKEDLKDIDLNKPVHLTFSFYDTEGNLQQSIKRGKNAEGVMDILAEYGDTYGFLLKGNRKDGFEILQ
ncbi:MAG: DUF4825 domain-containing protein, partial [Lachnospiraceae bacterium]|nr:DUF4825 domain-containing protein [Lachnospiraceae bacterium]